MSLTSGELCVGAVATWTCNVEGSSSLVAWRNLGDDEPYNSFSNDFRSLGSTSPFSARATCYSNDIKTSIATANLTTAVNGSTLECADNLFFVAGRNITSINLSVKSMFKATF